MPVAPQEMVVASQEEVAKKLADELKERLAEESAVMEARVKRLEALERSLVERETKVDELSKMAELQAQQAKEAIDLMSQQQKEAAEEKEKIHNLLQMAAGPLSHRTDPMVTGGMSTGGDARRGTATPRSRNKSRQASARDRGLPPTALSAGIPDDANVVEFEGDDWVQLWDPDEYSWYWYNRRTQEAQWEYPGTDIDYSGYESTGGMTDYSTDAGEESGYESEYGIANHSGNGGSPWQEYWDEQAQAKYWYNQETGEASWTRPDTASRPGSARSGVKNSGADDWVSYIDPDTDQEYWYNAATGETSWDPK